MLLGLENLSALSTGRPVRLSKDGQPEWMTYGAQIGWALVTAQVGDGTLTIDDTPYKDGDKLLPVGTIMVKLTGGANVNEWVPFEDGAANGQGTLTPGNVGLLDLTIKQKEPLLGRDNDDLVGLIIGGYVFEQRIQYVTGVDQAALLAVLPRLVIN